MIDLAFRRTWIACRFARHRVLSAIASLTAGLARRAPNTLTEAMVARASSGVTSWAMLARPSTLMCSISPARRAASRSSRLEVAQAEIQTFSGCGLLDHVCVTLELVADGRSNEIRAVRIETFPYHQVDVPQIDKSLG